MIDAHVHVWRIGANGCIWPTEALPALHRDFDLADFRATEGTGEIDGVILVQSQEDAADTAWLLSLAEDDPLVAGVVGWCDLHASDAPARIAALSAHRKLRGLRPMVQDRAADWYDDPAIEPALMTMTTAGLVLEALVRSQHLPALARLARRHPDLAIVIDHAAKPDFDALDDWHAAMRDLARCPRVYCKLSGLLTEMRSDAVATVVPMLRTLFGPDRLIWGSDWPVVLLAGSYADWLAQARSLIESDQHPGVFRDTAARLYGIAA